MQELTLPAPVTPGPHCQDASRPMFEHMLDVVDYGMLLLLPNAQVIFANQAARAELQDHPVLRLRGAALQLQQSGDAAALRDALVAAMHKGFQKLLTLGDEPASMLSIAVVPLVEPGATGGIGAMLLLGKRQVCDELSIECFARQQGLTLAELRVLKLLGKGRKPAEIATILGVALSTVRTQIASILEKTGTPGIGTLLRELSRLPPLRSLLRAA